MKEEEVLNTCEAKYKAVFDSVNDAIFIHDPDTGAILEFNRKAAEMFGYKEDEALSLTVEDLSSGVPPYTGEGAIEKIRAAVKQGGLLFEWHCKDRSGRLFWVEVNVKPAVMDGEQRVIAVVRDMTMRKNAEDAIRESEEKYRSIFQSSIDGILITSPDGRIHEANPAACRIMGMTEEEIVQAGREGVAVTSDPRMKALLEERARTGYARGVVIHKRKDGETYPIEISTSLIKDRNGNTNASVIFRDIAERLRAEEALRESEERFRVVQELSPDGFTILRPVHDAGGQVVDFTWVYENDAIARLNGTDPKAAVGRRLLDIFPSHRGSPIFEAYKHVAETGKTCILETSYQGETIVSLKWLRLVVVSMGRDIAVLAQDITGRKKVEETLARERQLLQTVLGAVATGVVFADVEGNITYYSPSAIRLLGCPPTGKAGRADSGSYQLLKTDGAPFATEEMPLTRSIHGDHVVQDVEMIVLRTDGTRVTLLVTTVPTHDAHGRVTGAVAAMQDITERKRAEEKIRTLNEELEEKVHDRTVALSRTVAKLDEQKELLQAIIDNIPVVITVWRSDRKLLMVNKEFERLSGWSREEAMNMDIITASFPDPAYRNEIIRLVTKAVPGWGEFVWTIRSGGKLNIAWAAVDLSGGSRIGIGIDITERRKMEKDMLSLVAAIDQAGEGVLLFSPEWVIEYVNPAYERLSGFSRSELMGKRPDFLDDSIIGGYHPETPHQVASRGEIWKGQARKQKKSGEIVDIHITASPVRNEKGEVINYVSVVQDITQENRLQDMVIQSQKVEAIGTLASGIAHDLKNIFTPILINSETALEDVGEDHPARHLLEEILGAARMGGDLVKQIMTFARRAPGEKVPVNVPSLVKETLALLRSTIPAAIDIQHRFSSEDLRVMADPTQIKQIVMNLGSNAAHAMKKRGGVLEVDVNCVDLQKDEASRISPDLASGSYVEVDVCDTGEGIDEETRQHIFEPFFTTKGYGEGTGLGLAVVQGIAKGHQGAVTVWSRPGKGSRFRVLLPRLDQACNEKGQR